MIRKSAKRFSEKIMRNKELKRDDDSISSRFGGTPY